MLSIHDILKKLEYISNTKKIITVTLNPVIDRTLIVNNFEAGKTYVIEESKNIAAGKGINVSRALLNLKIKSIATGILPEVGSDYFKHYLYKEGITHDFLMTHGTVRINTTIVSSRQRETHLREKGKVFEDGLIDKLLNKLIQILSSHSNKETSIVFSGSIPEGLPKNSYKILIEKIKKYTNLIFLDSSGPALKNGIKALPDGIKPNISEAEDVIGKKDFSFKKALKYFYEMGIKHIFLSMGKDGILYYDGDNTYRASVNVKNPINTVGSGDSSVAGVIAGIVAGLSSDEIVALACTMGAANTLTNGAGNFTIKDILNIFPEVKIDILNKKI